MQADIAEDDYVLMMRPNHCNLACWKINSTNQIAFQDDLLSIMHRIGFRVYILFPKSLSYGRTEPREQIHILIDPNSLLILKWSQLRMEEATNQRQNYQTLNSTWACQHWEKSWFNLRLPAWRWSLEWRAFTHCETDSLSAKNPFSQTQKSKQVK